MSGKAIQKLHAFAPHTLSGALRLATMILALCGPTAHAGRPMATEDASTNPAAQCQLEAWMEKTAEARFTHLAPACGLGAGFELGLEAVSATPGEEQVQARSGTVKWAPEWLAWKDWRFGLKGGTVAQKGPGEGKWHKADWSGLGIASLAINEQWALHINAGHQHDVDSKSNVMTYSVGLNWAPVPRWQAFAEVMGDHKHTATQSAGMRWWILPEQLGLDVTAARVNASANSRSWAIGLGWYGLHF